MSDHKTFADTSFDDFMSMVRIHAQAAEYLYRRVIGSQDSQETREDLLNSIHDGANSFALASAKVLSDLQAIDRMSADADDSDQEMWAAIAADVADGVTDLSTLDEFVPASDAEKAAARKERDEFHMYVRPGDLGDLLAPEPFGWAPEAHDLKFPAADEEDES